MLIEVGGAAVTRSIPFTNTVAVAQADPLFCSAHVYTFVPPLANVLSMTGTTLTGISSSVSDVISTSVTMTVSLENYS